MKETRVRHINKIPNNWNLIKIKYLFNIGRGRVISELELNPEGLYPVYSSQTKDDGCMGYINTFDYSIPQLTWTTDGVYAGTVFYREGKYNCTNICGTLAPKSSDFDLRFLKYALEFIAIYHKRPDTNGAKIMNNEMANIEVPLPHLVEQKSIVKFLNTKCFNIDCIINDLEKQIEILEKYKKSVITEAVTKGLNPDVELKDSGIIEFGKIPSTWTIKRLKFMLNNDKNSMRVGPFGSEIKTSDYTPDGEYWVYNQRTVIDNNFETNDTLISKDKYLSLKSFSVYPKDILITTRGTIGRVSIAPDNLNEGVLHPCIIKFTVDEQLLCNELVEYIFNFSDFVINQLKRKSNSTTIEVIYSYNLREIYLPVIPTNEQKEILEYLNNKCSKIDSIIEDKNKQLETIKKYKNSLIYEYVTGKKRVGQGDVNE